jgi:hypothetical protein
MHTTFASLGTLVLLKLGRFKLSRLGRKEHLILVAFSVLFTANIAMSNLSLYVFHEANYAQSFLFLSIAL